MSGSWRTGRREYLWSLRRGSPSLWFSAARAHLTFAFVGKIQPPATVQFPIGHRRCRAEGVPLLLRKFQEALATRFPEPRAQAIYGLCQDHRQFDATAVNELMDLLIVCTSGLCR